MCMLCGCDYLEPIKGVGAKTALKMVKEYDTFDDILEHLRKGKNPPPDDWPCDEARELFKHPNVTPASEIEVRTLSISYRHQSRAGRLTADHIMARVSSHGRSLTSRAWSSSSCETMASSTPVA